MNIDSSLSAKYSSIKKSIGPPPSSLHESIILPADGSVSYQELADMVTDINVNVVSVEERLSDHVYLYEREEGVLKIAA